MPTGQYLWEKKNIVPFLKCDNGLAEESDGVQLMKPIPSLDELLVRAKSMRMYGTKMRSVIKMANPEGIRAVIKQQFDIGKQILGHGLVPIIEPEVDIHSPEKEACEELLKTELLEQLNALDEDHTIILKLTLPSKVNHYKDCVDHPNCKRVLALSGGYSRQKANEILAQQNGMIASFSRALSEGLNHNQTDESFDKILAESISSIFSASKGG
jgi:fructose-bisphosphate aldolase class I